MAKNYSNAYVIIRKEDNICTQVNFNNNPNWVLDNDYCFNIPVDTSLAAQYLDKYYYDAQWYNRVWNEYTTDEFGENVPVIEKGYVDYEWSPVVGE